MSTAVRHFKAMRPSSTVSDTINRTAVTVQVLPLNKDRKEAIKALHLASPAWVVSDQEDRQEDLVPMFIPPLPV